MEEILVVFCPASVLKSLIDELTDKCELERGAHILFSGITVKEEQGYICIGWNTHLVSDAFQNKLCALFERDEDILDYIRIPCYVFCTKASDKETLLNAKRCGYALSTQGVICRSHSKP